MRQSAPVARGDRFSVASPVGLVLIFSAVGSIAPEPALAHGLGATVDLPIPAWLFTWAAAAVLIVSFVALATWDVGRPKVSSPRAVATVPRPVEVLCGLAGIAVFVLVVYAGLAGSSQPLKNIAPTVVYVLLWVGVSFCSALIGDFFPLFSPWRAVARAVAWLVSKIAPRAASAPEVTYPRRLGVWPSVCAIVTFGFLELCFADGSSPQLLATLAVLYMTVSLVGMSIFGIETWCDRADGFAVMFRVLGTLAPLELRGRAVYVRRPLAGGQKLEMQPGMLAMILVMIGITTFDGASNSMIWTETVEFFEPRIAGLGINATRASEIVSTCGLAFSILIIICVYRGGVSALSRRAGVGKKTMFKRYAYTLLPVVFAYFFAHYFSLLLIQGQAIIAQVSDPLGDGSDLFGTADYMINYELLSPSVIWYVQIASLVAGHVGGLALSHRETLLDLAPRKAAKAEFSMLIVMVFYTTLGLWLLSSVAT